MTGRWRLDPTLLVLLCVLKASAVAAQAPDELRVVLRAGTGVFVSGSEEEPDGFDVELMRRFVAWHKSGKGKDLSCRITFVDTLNELLNEAEAGRCDFALGSVTATAERDRRVDFSDPYLPVRMILMARAGRLPPGGSRESLAGKRIGALLGSTHASALQELQKEVSGVSLNLEYRTVESLFSDLLRSDSNLDAAATDLTHYWVLKRTEDLALVASLGPEQGLAFVLPEGSELRGLLNEFLEHFTHNQSYFTLVRKYFGDEADAMVRMARER